MLTVLFNSTFLVISGNIYERSTYYVLIWMLGERKFFKGTAYFTSRRTSLHSELAVEVFATQHRANEHTRLYQHCPQGKAVHLAVSDATCSINKKQNCGKVGDYFICLYLKAEETEYIPDWHKQKMGTWEG